MICLERENDSSGRYVARLVTNTDKNKLNDEDILDGAVEVVVSHGASSGRRCGLPARPGLCTQP